MNNLYIDAGWSHLGYAIYKKGIRDEYGEIHASQNDKQFRIKYITKKLEEIIKKHEIESVYCEDFIIFSKHSRSAQNVLLAIGAIIKTCIDMDIPVELVNYNKWRSIYKKMENKPKADDISEHARDAILMGAAIEGGTNHVYT